MAIMAMPPIKTTTAQPATNAQLVSNLVRLPASNMAPSASGSISPLSAPATISVCTGLPNTLKINTEDKIKIMVAALE